MFITRFTRDFLPSLNYFLRIVAPCEEERARGDRAERAEREERSSRSFSRDVASRGEGTEKREGDDRRESEYKRERE